MDISGFTALSEKLQHQDARHGVERLKMHINNYFTLLLDKIEQ